MYKKILIFMCCTNMLQGADAQIDDHSQFKNELVALFEEVQRSPWCALTIYHTDTGIGFAQAAQALTELTGDQKYQRNAAAILAKQSQSQRPPEIKPSILNQTIPPTPTAAAQPKCAEHVIEVRFSSSKTPTQKTALSSCPELPTKHDSSSYRALAGDTKKSALKPSLCTRLIECCLRKKR